MNNPDQSKFINADRLNEFRGTGGVRLEDTIVITKNGCDNLTLCPRSVDEVLDVMNHNGVWPPKVDRVPELRRNWVKKEGGQMIPVDMPTS